MADFQIELQDIVIIGNLPEYLYIPNLFGYKAELSCS